MLTHSDVSMKCVLTKPRGHFSKKNNSRNPAYTISHCFGFTFFQKFTLYFSAFPDSAPNPGFLRIFRHCRNPHPVHSLSFWCLAPLCDGTATAHPKNKQAGIYRVRKRVSWPIYFRVDMKFLRSSVTCIKQREDESWDSLSHWDVSQLCIVKKTKTQNAIFNLFDIKKFSAISAFANV